MSPASLLDQPIQLRPDYVEDVEDVEDEVSDQDDDNEDQSQDSESAQSDLGFEDEVLQQHHDCWILLTKSRRMT